MLIGTLVFLILLGIAILGHVLRTGLITMAAGMGFVLFGLSMWGILAWLSIILVVLGLILVWQGAR